VLDRAGCSADTPPRRSGQSWLMASAANFGHRCTRLQTSTAVDRPDNAEDSLPVTAEGHRRDRDLGHPRERPPAAGPDSRALSLIARGVVGSIESHVFTPEEHCPQTLRTARPPSGLSVRPGLTRPLCWRCIEHDGRVLGTDSEPRRTGFRTPIGLARGSIRSARSRPAASLPQTCAARP
jgi:hypothetical protein